MTNKHQTNTKQKPNQKIKKMAFKKSTLNKLKRELINHNIRAKAIEHAATEKGKSTELVRLVLNGQSNDVNNIIECLYEFLEKEKTRVAKVSKKIDTV